MRKYFKISLALMVALTTIISTVSLATTRLTTTWYYHGDNDPENFNDPQYWLKTSNSPLYTCGGEDGIPCSIVDSPYDIIGELTTNVLIPNPEEAMLNVATEAEYAL